MKRKARNLIILPLDSIVEDMSLMAMEDVKLAVKPGAFHLLNKVNRILAAEGVPSYLVGGFVRDLLYGRDTADIDIAVGADALETARKIAAELGGKFVPLDAENGVARVIIPGEACHLDFSTLHGDIEDDLGRRDFTVDAIAIPLDSHFSDEIDVTSLIDPFQGREDLQRRILRVVNPGVFAADAIRLLRAIRIAAELGLCIEHLTEMRIRQKSRLISTVAAERVREELLRILALPGAGPRLAYLDELGLLTALIPELEQARGVSQPLMHIWDVFTHSIQTVATIEFLLRERTWDYAGENILAAVPWSERLQNHFDSEINSSSTRKALLKLAALLHDIAKPETKTTDSDGRTRFLGHPQEGAATAAAILERLRFSNHEIEYIELLITHHLRPTQMSHEGLPTSRAVYRFFRDTGDTGIDLLFLSLADHLAARGATLDIQQWQEHTSLTCDVLKRRFEEESIIKPAVLIDGHDIMKSFRLAAGPRIGQLLEAVREAQAAGEITDKQGALRYVKLILADDNTPGINLIKE
jgi:poly(A) polymerase